MKNNIVLRRVLIAVLALAVIGAPAGVFAFMNARLKVPNLVFLDEDDAKQAINNAGFVLGDETYEFDETAPSGTVIKQQPAAMKMAKRGTSINIVVSKGKEAAGQVTMPDLIGKTQEEAEKLLIDAKLVPVPGNPVNSDTVTPGLVCQQSVQAGKQVTEGSQVSFNVSLGKAMTKVPNVTGKSADEARAMLKDAKLGVDVTTTYDDTVAKDIVISQSIEADVSVAEGTTVKLSISLGQKPVEKVAVPDIMTHNLDEAIQALESAGLKYTYSGDPTGTVSAVNPAVGTEVNVGSTVNFTLQHVATLIAVPDVAGMNGVDARAAFDLVGLTLDYDVRQPERILSGTNPAAGTLVDPSTIVEATYDDPVPETVDVPDVAGMTGTDANDAMNAAGLQLSYDTDDPDRTLTGTDPAAGTTVQKGSTVNAVYETESVSVPDVAGMTGADAKAVIEEAGLQLDYDVRQPDRVLDGTDPAAGTELAKGTFVTAVYPEVEPQAGGWETSFESSSMDDTEERDLFQQAVAGTSAESDPVATIAREQTEVGKNFLVLSHTDSTWKLSRIDVDSDGTPTLASTKGFDLNSIATTDHQYEGDWSVDTSAFMSLPGNAADAFQRATSSYSGVSLSPVALLGHQAVAGTNYRVLAVGGSGQTYVVTIYDSVGGEATVSDITYVALDSYL